MSCDPLILNRDDISHLETTSLLRVRHHTTEIFQFSPWEGERARAKKVVEYIMEELEKRNQEGSKPVPYFEPKLA